MLFRQILHHSSCTYCYIVAAHSGGEALIIDPVLEQVDHYLRLMRELDLKLVKAIDTHVHADHITGLGELRDRTRCITVMGEQSSADVVSMRVREGDTIEISGIRMETIYTPGHTDDSYSFLLGDRVFTGDTLLIRGTGRTDFQNGDPVAQYDSLFNKLLKLPDDTLVYPAHDYNGDTVSTIGEEKAHSPRLQAKSVDEYAEIMNGLNLQNPKMMDVAVPANQRIGLLQKELEARGCALNPTEAIEILGHPGVLFVDLRDDAERARHGVILDSIHTPYTDLEQQLKPGGLLRELAGAAKSRLVFYCAYGERSALAVSTAEEAGLQNVCSISGGIEEWKKSALPLESIG
jgi:glyoxylase-like metal-dependent hydrolase (beta-lactamase superfamily II)/rhodanese-related sulfurtransferase